MNLLEFLRPFVEQLEERLTELPIVSRRLDQVERKQRELDERLGRVASFAEGYGGQGSGAAIAKGLRALPDLAALDKAIADTQRKAAAHDHDLGPWTRPPTLERPAFAICRRCGHDVFVTVEGKAGGAATTTACAKAAGRRYESKPCAKCAASFSPSGPRALYCEKCRPSKAAA